MFITRSGDISWHGFGDLWSPPSIRVDTGYQFYVQRNVEAAQVGSCSDRRRFHLFECPNLSASHNNVDTTSMQASDRVREHPMHMGPSGLYLHQQFASVGKGASSVTEPQKPVATIQPIPESTDLSPNNSATNEGRNKAQYAADILAELDLEQIKAATVDAAAQDQIRPRLDEYVYKRFASIWSHDYKRVLDCQELLQDQIKKIDDSERAHGTAMEAHEKTLKVILAQSETLADLGSVREVRTEDRPAWKTYEELRKCSERMQKLHAVIRETYEWSINIVDPERDSKIFDAKSEDEDGFNERPDLDRSSFGVPRDRSYWKKKEKKRRKAVEETEAEIGLIEEQRTFRKRAMSQELPNDEAEKLQRLQEIVLPRQQKLHADAKWEYERPRSAVTNVLSENSVTSKSQTQYTGR